MTELTVMERVDVDIDLPQENPYDCHHLGLYGIYYSAFHVSFPS